MLPTSSSTFLVGRNARSATARINSSRSSQGLGHRRRGSPRVSLRHPPSKDQLATVAGGGWHAGQPATVVRRQHAWYVPTALSGWRVSSFGIIAGVAATLALAACGSGARQDASEPRGNFTVTVPAATFPVSQQLSEHTHLVIAVRNAGKKAIPDVAVTICNVTCVYPAPRGEGTAAQAFAEDLTTPNLANSSRPVWIVDRGPGTCGSICGGGGGGGGGDAGGAGTAYSNTWAMGALKPGHTATFRWAVTAVKPGSHRIAWQIAADLNGRATAVLANGSKPGGTFDVTISNTPQQTYVNGGGQIVPTQ